MISSDKIELCIDVFVLEIEYSFSSKLNDLGCIAKNYIFCILIIP